MDNALKQLKDLEDKRSRLFEKDILSLQSTLAEVNLKMKSTNDKVDALSTIVNDLSCSKENWRSERVGISSMVEHLQALLIEREEMEVFQNQVTQTKSTRKENIDSQTIKSKPIDDSKDSNVIERMKFESDKIRTNLYEKDQTILFVRKEMEAALASLKEVELEMNRKLDEKEEFRKVEEEGRNKIEMLATEIKNSQVEDLDLATLILKVEKRQNVALEVASKVEKVRREKDKLYLLLDESYKMMEMADLRREKETLSKWMVDKVSEMEILHQELDGHIKGLVVAKEELLKRDEEIESLHRQLEGASSSFLCLEQEEIENMGLKEKIGKEVEAHKRLSSKLQQSNDVAAKTRLFDLEGRVLSSLPIDIAENTSLKIDLKCKEEVLKGLQFDLNLLQEFASKGKDRKYEVQEAITSLKILQEDLSTKTIELNTILL
eukprot:Gb_32488 [translate_table: standard]